MKRYRVVETKWVGGLRVEYVMDGYNWVTEKIAKQQLKVIAAQFTNRLFSVQNEK